MTIDPIRRRLVAMTTVAVAVLAMLAACSLPVDERVTPLDQGDFPDDLTEETTTTTTTTTTVPPTTVPEDTSVDPEETTTTSTPVVQTEAVTVFYTRGATDVVLPVEVPRPVGTRTVGELISLLEQPTGITEFGLRSAVRPGLIDRIVVDRGVATVVLDQTVLDRMSEANRQQAIAQIVLTVTSFRTVDAGAIGRVRFEVDGDGLAVFVPAFGGFSEPGEELAFQDFQSLIASTPTATTSTTTTTGPVATTEPPADEADGQ